MLSTPSDLLWKELKGKRYTQTSVMMSRLFLSWSPWGWFAYLPYGSRNGFVSFFSLSFPHPSSSSGFLFGRDSNSCYIFSFLPLFCLLFFRVACGGWWWWWCNIPFPEFVSCCAERNLQRSIKDEREKTFHSEEEADDGDGDDHRLCYSMIVTMSLLSPDDDSWRERERERVFFFPDTRRETNWLLAPDDFDQRSPSSSSQSFESRNHLHVRHYDNNKNLLKKEGIIFGGTGKDFCTETWWWDQLESRSDMIIICIMMAIFPFLPSIPDMSENVSESIRWKFKREKILLFFFFWHLLMLMLLYYDFSTIPSSRHFISWCTVAHLPPPSSSVASFRLILSTNLVRRRMMWMNQMIIKMMSGFGKEETSSS